MLSVLLVVAALHFTRESLAVVPQKPHLSSFTAEFSVLGAGTELDHVLYYANAQEKKQLQILDLGNEEGVQLYTWLIGEHNMTREHDNMKPFDFCTSVSVPSSASDTNLWFWLKNATYHGTRKFQEKTIDVWTYEDKANDNFYQVGVLSSNPNEVVYYLSNTALGVIVFDRYENSAPPDSVFDIPTSCKGATPPEKAEMIKKYNFNAFKIRKW